jgi:hypothetical protein
LRLAGTPAAMSPGVEPRLVLCPPSTPRDHSPERLRRSSTDCRRERANTPLFGCCFLAVHRCESAGSSHQLSPPAISLAQSFKLRFWLSLTGDEPRNAQNCLHIGYCCCRRNANRAATSPPLTLVDVSPIKRRL